MRAGHTFSAAVLAIVVAGCATQYKEMGATGGVMAARIDADTFQITARGNAFTDPDTIQRFALRKAAEETIANGYDVFEVVSARDRSRTGRHSSAYGTARGGYVVAWGSGWDIIKPGETVLIKMRRGPKPSDAPAGVFDAREVLRYMVGTFDPPAPK